jgi:hypothetical protein
MIASDQKAGRARDHALSRHHSLRSNVRRTQAASHLREQLAHALQGRATNYIGGGILAAIHRRGLEQEMTMPLAGGRGGLFG